MHASCCDDSGTMIIRHCLNVSRRQAELCAQVDQDLAARHGVQRRTLLEERAIPWQPLPLLDTDTPTRRRELNEHPDGDRLASVVELLVLVREPFA